MKRINMHRNRRIAAMAITKKAVTHNDMLSILVAAKRNAILERRGEPSSNP
jgi:hypothetical protein